MLMPNIYNNENKLFSFNIWQVFTFFICFLIFSQSSGIDADKVVETVDLTDLGYVKTKTSFILSKTIFDKIQPDHIEHLCSRYGIEPCKIEIDNVKREISFNTEQRPDLFVESIKKEANILTITCKHNYHVLQHIFGSKISSNDRLMAMSYPTHVFSYEKPLMHDIANTFQIKKTFVDGNIKISDKKVIAGGTISISNWDGELCYGEVEDERGIKSSVTAINCKDASLTIDPRFNTGNYMLNLFAYSKKQLIYQEIPVEIEKASFSVLVSIENDNIIAGQAFKLNLLPSDYRDIDRCKIFISDNNDNILNSYDFNQCEDVFIGTKSSWADGPYNIKIYSYSKSEESISHTIFHINNGGIDAPSANVEKNVFVAGESVVVHSSFSGADSYCVSRLYDINYDIISYSESFGCERTEIQLDETLKKGTYILKTNLYKKGRLKGFETIPIQVNEWDPTPGSWMDRMCLGSFYKFEDIQLPCIKSGQMCRPTSLDLPLCMCFSKEGDIRDVCRYGDLCNENKCQSYSVSPYTIVRDNDQCLALRGDQKMECISTGELCSGSCVCINEYDHPVAKCGPQTICMPGGCAEPKISFETKSFSPENLPTYSLGDSATFTWTGVLKHDDKIINMPIENAINVTTKLDSINGKISLSQEKEGIISIKTTFKGELSPGKYFIYLYFSSMQGNEQNLDKLVIKHPVEVWYDDTSLILRIISMSPETLVSSNLKNQDSIGIKCRIFNKKGEEIKNLSIGDFSLDINGLKTLSTSAIYDGSFWTVVGHFQGKKIQSGNKKLTLSINHLGRSVSESKTVNILSKTPLELNIMKVDPGTKFKPLFYMLVGTGFDIDIYLHLSGQSTLDKSHFQVKINGKDVSHHIAYIIETVKGVKIRLSSVKLCPERPPAPNTEIPLEITVRDGSKEAIDSTNLLIKGNAGDWSNLKQSGCS